MLTIERDAAVSNSLDVVPGRDVNEDGILGVGGFELGSAPARFAFAAESVHEGRLLKRIAQIGAGKVFRSLAFMTEKASDLGHRFKTLLASAHPVGEIGYSTLGWRLAQAAA